MNLSQRKHLLIEPPLHPFLVDQLFTKDLDGATHTILLKVSALRDNREAAASEDSAHMKPGVKQRAVELVQLGRKCCQAQFGQFRKRLAEPRFASPFPAPGSGQKNSAT